ncbi:glycosyltransferase [Halomicroarcula sp. GCM10025894]|uniref:glycosyltransferase n=1 Tax=Halomicroarcula sp. GCM10025894 TaxID=3252673 RepID=UPI003606614C
MSTIASNSTERRLTSDVVIGIPAYNEADTVGDVVRAASDPSVDVVVVDDGSDDSTAAVAADAGATVLQHGDNRGYGAHSAHCFRLPTRTVWTTSSSSTPTDSTTPPRP